ncbi:MAG: hypothetical protein WCT12_34945 [Verrucomicrobiota bacterium]
MADQVNLTPPDAGTCRVLLGGSCYSDTIRRGVGRSGPGCRIVNYGFRCEGMGAGGFKKS